MNIGFDLDRVLVNYPPFIPAWLIDWLYRHHDKKELTYRIPRSKIEQFLRKVSHFYLFRPEIKENIEFAKKLPANSHHYNLYLISSRYKFLENITHKILKRYGLKDVFCSVNLNVKNEQPHFFKEKVIKRLNISLYIDDDLELLRYLKHHCPKVQLLWYHPDPQDDEDLSGIIRINNLEEIKNYLK